MHARTVDEAHTSHGDRYGVRGVLVRSGQQSGFNQARDAVSGEADDVEAIVGRIDTKSAEMERMLSKLEGSSQKSAKAQASPPIAVRDR